MVDLCVIINTDERFMNYDGSIIIICKRLGLAGATSNIRDNAYSSCLLIIQIIQLTFTDFNTESSYDFVRLYDGTNTSYALLASLSGSGYSGSRYRSSGGHMFVTFTSDGSVVRHGFMASYTIINRK